MVVSVPRRLARATVLPAEKTRMARPRSFEVHLVLTRMMQVFWAQGYAASSMRDLEQVSGLTPGSLYHAFGHKRDLFARVLGHYLDTVVARRISGCLDNAESPMAGLRAFLVTALPAAASPGEGPRGCLLVNSALELGQQDPQIGPVIRRGLEQIEVALIVCAERARAAGELSPDLAATLVAREISLLLPGLLLAAHNGMARESLVALIDFVLDRLRPRPVATPP